jgi:glucose-1-phosphatase
VTIRAVVFDLDGVVRHFDPCDAIETEYGLAPGTLTTLPYEPELLNPTVTGQWSYEEWIDAIGQCLSARHGEHTRAAATAFGNMSATIDADVLDLARRLRAHYTVAVLTNGTTRVEDELHALGVDTSFDYIFNSARIGYAKPDVRAFEHVVQMVRCAPEECVFTDDSEPKLAGAYALGMRTVHFTGAAAFESQLRAWGVRC